RPARDRAADSALRYRRRHGPAVARAAGPAAGASGKTPPDHWRCHSRPSPAVWPSDSRPLTTVISQNAGGQRLGIQGNLAALQGLLDFLHPGQTHVRQRVQAFLQGLQAQLCFAGLLALALAGGHLGADRGGFHGAKLYGLEGPPDLHWCASRIGVARTLKATNLLQNLNRFL